MKSQRKAIVKKRKNITTEDFNDQRKRKKFERKLVEEETNSGLSFLDSLTDVF